MYHYTIVRAHCTELGTTEDGKPKRHYRHDIDRINEYASKGYRIHSFFGNFGVDTIMEAELPDEEKADRFSV